MSEEIATQAMMHDPLPEFHKLGFRWVILIVYCVLNFAMIYATMGLAGLSARIIVGYSVTAQSFAFMSTIPYLIGFILCFFTGALSDKFGVKVVLTVCVAIAAVGGLLRALFVDSFTMLTMANLLIGVGAGGMNSTVQKIFQAWFSPKQFNVAIGVYISIATIGAAVGMMASIMFPETVTFMWVTTIILVICAILSALFIRNTPPGYPEQEPEPFIRYLGEALKHKSVWIAGILFFLLYGSVVADNQFWVSACVLGRGVPEATASLIGSVTVLGCIVGSILIPEIVSRKGHSRMWTIVLGFLSAIFLAIAWNIPFGALTVVFFILHLVCNGGLLGQVKALPGQLSDLDPKYIGAAAGFQAAMQNIGAFIIPTYVVALIAGENYMLMYNIIVGILFLFAILSIFIPKNAGIK